MSDRGPGRRPWTLELALWVVAAACFLLAAWLDGERGGRGGAPPPRGDEPEALRLVTWNVGGASPRSQRRLRDELVDAVTRTLDATEADVVLLQELRSEDQAARIADRLARGPWRHAAGPNGVAILARGFGLTPFDIGQGEGALFAVLTDDAAARPLAVTVLHADAFSSADRNREIGRAADELLRIDGVAPVLAGDLNLDVDLDKRRDLVTDDAYRDVETYNYLASRLVDATLGTGATAEPDRRLDYVFFHPDHFELRYGAPWPGRREGDMDHDPVVVDLRAR